MGKFIITENDKKHIKSLYGVLNEQEPYAGPSDEEIKNALPEQQVAWRANQIQSQTLGTTYEDAEAQARKELNVPKQTTTGQEQYTGAMSSNPEAYEKFQKENPQPSPQQNVSQGQNVNKYNYPRPYLNQNTSQQSTTNQGQNVVADLNKSLATIGGEGKGVSTTTVQSAPNYNVNYKVLTPQKLTNIRTQINSTGKGNTLTPEDLQALYTTISKLPNKK
jgi:hypothetical protein